MFQGMKYLVRARHLAAVERLLRLFPVAALSGARQDGRMDVG